MAHDDMERILRATLAARADAALLAYGEAWAAEARRIVSVRTGALQGSIQAVQTTPGVVELQMKNYGRFVSDGHRIWNWGTSTRPHRVYKTKGFVPGTYFIAIAQRAPAVRAARARIARILAGKE